MKRDISTISFVIVVFAILELFCLNPAFAKKDCEERLWKGDYEIQTIKKLEALSGYTSVTGTLSIYSSALTSLDGLKCLTSVGEGLYIEYNDSLTSLKGLKNLTSVGGDFEVAENHELCTSAAKALRGQLLGAGGIGGDVDISDNKYC
jgi:hypothetical protein